MSFVTVKGRDFYYQDQVYFIRGANYWQGINLAAKTEAGGDRIRLKKELDQLVKMGVNNLRIMASSEGPDDQPYRMRPSLQPSPGQYNEDIFEALDYLLVEMSKRSMTAVMTLSNFWHWSGGFSQYIAWVTRSKIPYPVTRDEWDAFTEFTCKFYNDPSIKTQVNKLYKDHIKAVQTRRNTINGKLYNQDPVIMAWQIANEPQLAPKDWYQDVAYFIKQGSPHQLVSAGIEAKVDQIDFINAHESVYIDYCTCHLWVENWGAYDPRDASTLENAQAYAKQYLKIRSEWAKCLNKPIVLEEFGMARDAWRKPTDSAYKYDPDTPTSHKDVYYEGLYQTVLNVGMNGTNFWAYGGLGRPTDGCNKFGMIWLGDPPHEPKGWYSVYDKDSSTINVIEKHFNHIKKNNKL